MDTRAKSALDGEEMLEAACGTGRYEWRPAQDHLIWSHGLLHIYGLKEAPSGETGFSVLVHPDDRVRVEAETAHFLGFTALAYSHAFRIVRPDGSIRRILDRGAIERDKQGRALVIRGMNIDLTDIPQFGCQHAEKTAVQPLAELEALYDEAPLGLGVLDRELRFVRINEALAEINGYSVQEHLGRSAWDLVPSLRESAESALRRVLETGLPLRNVVVRGETPARPGVTREWREHFYPRRGSDGSVQGIGIVCEEVTERRAFERELAESEARLRAALWAGRLGVHEFDPRTGEIYWDATVRDIWGASENEPITFDTFAAGLHPDDVAATKAALDAALDPDGSGRFETTYRVVHRQTKQVHWVRADGHVTFEGRAAIRLLGTVKDITEQKQKEEALASSELRFKLALEDSPITVFEHDVELRYQWLFNSKLGYSDTFAIGKTDEEIMDPAAAKALMKFKRRVLERGKSERQEVIAAAPGKPLEHYDLHAHPRRDASGRVIGLVCVATDITQQKRSEAVLRESEARFRNMADGAPVMVWVTEPDGSCSYLNSYWYGFTGQTAEEALGFGWLKAVHPDDTPESERVFREANARHEAFRLDYRLRRADGVYRWAIDSARPRLGAQGEFLGFIGTVIDISERKEAERALRAAHDTFRRLVDRSPFGIYAVDSDFRIAQVSDGARKIFENVRPLIGRDFAEVLRIIWPEPFASEAIDQFRHTLATGAPYHPSNLVERRADIGATESYDWKIEQITMPDGRPGVVCHFYDLSERQAHEQKIQYLMGEVNHRAKNMLTLVNSVAQQTAGQSRDDFLDRFSKRILALAAAQDLLVQTSWNGADLASLIKGQLLHFADLHGPSDHTRRTRSGGGAAGGTNARHGSA